MQVSQPLIGGAVPDLANRNTFIQSADDMPTVVVQTAQRYVAVGQDGESRHSREQGLRTPPAPAVSSPQAQLWILPNEKRSTIPSNVAIVAVLSLVLQQATWIDSLACSALRTATNVRMFSIRGRT